MASIVGRLARSFSQGGSGASGVSAEGDFHRRSSSSADYSPRMWPFLSSPSAQSRMASSPSFNDFSLSVQEDAAEEYGSLFDSVDSGGSSLLSDEPIFPMDKTNNEGQGQQGLHSLGPFASMPAMRKVAPPPPVSEPTVTATIDRMSSEPAVAATAARAVPSRQKSVKVMGMDAYDYCDLLRSSSL